MTGIRGSIVTSREPRYIEECQRHIKSGIIKKEELCERSELEILFLGLYLTVEISTR